MKGYDGHNNMSEIGKRDCDLCGSSDASFFVETEGIDFARGRSFRFARCKSCGLIYLDNDLSPEELESLDYKEYHVTPASFHRGTFSFVMSLFILMRAGKIEKMKQKGVILDVGYGNGGFLKKMLSRGWSCYGIDILPYAIESTGGKDSINIFCGRLNDIKLPVDFFDVVTFWQSFEHMREPSLSLRRVHDILKGSGILFISVPNVDSFEARISLAKWFGVQPPLHAYLYSPKTLIGLLEKNGFSVVDLKKNSVEYNFPLFAQTFFNAMGGETNLLYNFLRRGKYIEKTNAFLRLYTILLIVTLLPIVLCGTVVVYFINIICGNGSVIEIFAKKDKR